MTTSVAPWKVTGSRYLLRERFLTARVDLCVTPAGVEVPYYVLEYPGWVNIVALDRADHLVMVRQYRHALGDVSLELPGGAMDDKETPVEAAVRELIEETGFGDAIRVTLVASLSPNTATNANLIHTVLVEGVSKVGQPHNDGVEVLEAERVPYQQALDLAMNGAIMQSTHVASIVLGLKAAKKIKL